MKKPIIFIQGRTMDTWSTVLESADDAPALFKQALRDKYQSLPYTVRAPAVRGWRNSMPETVLCLDKDRIWVFADNKGKCASTELAVGDIDGIETGLDLLNAWIRFFSKGERITVRYNSVGERLYKPFVEAFRATAETTAPESAKSGAGEEAEQLLAGLLHRDYKYHSYSNSTLAGRKPAAAFYQPDGSITRRFLSPRTVGSYLFLKSNSLLYSFSEAKPVRDRKEASYSMVIRILRLGGRVSTTIVPTDKGYDWMLFSAFGKELFRTPLLESSKAAYGKFEGPLE